MNIVNRLTLRHLRLNRGRTAVTLLGIVLSVAMVCCVAGFVMSMRDILMREVIESSGDYHVVFGDVTRETAEAIMREDVFLNDYSYIDDGGAEGLPELFMRLKRPDRDIMDVVGAVADRHGAATYTLNHELLALEGVFPMDNVLMTFVVIAGIAVAVILIGSVMVIANAFNISSQERARQFGLLKSVGATGGQLFRSVLFEALVLTAVAIPIGLALGFLVQAIVLQLTNVLLSEISEINSGLAFRVVLSPAVAVFSSAVAIVTALLSAWIPALRAAAVSPVDAIRQTKVIAVRHDKDTRVSPIAGRIFGFEGTLAAKTLKRNRGKYRAAVASLTLSVILFVSMSSFVWTINRGVGLEYGGFDYDVAVFTSGRLEPLDRADAALRSIPGAKIQTSLRIHMETTVPDGFVTEYTEEMKTVDNGYGLTLHSMPDAELSKYLRPAGNDGELAGLLVNHAVYARGGKKMEVVPYHCEIGTFLPLRYDSADDEARSEIGGVTVGAVVTESSEEFPASFFDGSLINIYIPESAYRRLFAEYKGNQTTYAVTTADPDAFCETAEELLESETFDDGHGYGMQNVAQMTRLNRNITLIVMLFGYGFITMLSLIAVTSVVSTISTGMSLRRQEFAMLYSVGMTPEGMDKMLNLESLLYGLKSILIGLPVGVALSYLIYMGMSGTFEFAYEPPAAAMLIAIAAVMLLTFSTMRYGKRKLSKISIVEAIRGETT